ncbi:plasmid partitioning protein RepB [Gluconobacter kondonii]|uniref:Plasmid partitioning protein RepB n=2 Tax=Gluconobacter kondonii TaxID=941463 RepID=A0ABQ5WU56_9PROT|nr:plasmid partitioning protein RepB [Gluconobacter kondonii]MBS1078513.1 plasmid partitioning protein RepB [Gluconobacter kondonii]GLQ67092.1 plasmid partitioning protein RepB [Gluconobacter kondonii]
MARKHNLGNLISAQSLPTNKTQEASPTSLSGSYRSSGALGSVAKSLGSLRQKADEAAELENLLKTGATIIELSPVLVETSFVSDRMPGNEEAYLQLRDAIKNTGQLSPILVRPHPTKAGHYQTAYGHRRLRACRELGLSVKAAVKELSDHDLIIAQGQENSARADLSFIERATFARRLLERGYERSTIMTALNTDKTALSRMLSVSEAIPPILIEWLGPCPSIGRPRWQELAENLKASPNQKSWEAFIEASGKTEDVDKFAEILERVQGKARQAGQLEKQSTKLLNDAASAARWVSTDKFLSIDLEAKKRATNLVFKSADASEFASFVMTAVPDLYEQFKAQTIEKDKPKN